MPTMIEAAAPVVDAPAAPANDAGARPSLSARAEALRSKLEESGATTEEPFALGVESSESDAAAPPPDAATTETPAAPPADDAQTKARTERIARIEAMRAKEREREQARQQRRQQRQSEGEVEKLRTRIAELEPLNEVFANEEALLAAAEQRGMTPEKLIAWMKTKLTDPSAAAQRQAQSVEEKLRAELREVRERIERSDRERAEEREQAEAQRAALSRATEFAAQVGQRAESHPLAAAFAKRHGDANTIAFANSFIIPHLPEEYSLDELHDHLEQFLDELQVASDRPANGTSHPEKKNGAAKPATTLSNSVVGGRESVTEEVPLARLPLKERSARLKASLGSE